MPEPPNRRKSGDQGAQRAHIPPDAADRKGVANTVTHSRAVVRTVEPGNSASCAHCGAPVKFQARTQQRQVIANVYIEGVWNRVEHFHEACYEQAGAVHGPAA